MSSPAGGGCGLIDGGADESAESESELLSCKWSMVNEIAQIKVLSSKVSASLMHLCICACVALYLTFILSSCILALWCRSSAFAVCVVDEVMVVVVHILPLDAEFCAVALSSTLSIGCSSIAAASSGCSCCSRALSASNGMHLVVVVFSKLLQCSLCVVVVVVALVVFVVVDDVLVDDVMLLLLL